MQAKTLLARILAPLSVLALLTLILAAAASIQESRRDYVGSGASFILHPNDSRGEGSRGPS